ncbi:MAG: ATP-grasp fold amidoligase family protein [Eubacteriales bacterium]
MRAVCVCTNRSEKHADYYFFDRDFVRLPVNEATANMPESLVIARPARYDDMIRIAEALAKGMRHVRVDLYDTESGIRFGELTFFDQSGFADDYVGDGDRIMGEFLKLEEQA